MLLDGMFLDLENYLKDLMTRSWLGAGTVIDTFIATCEDYGNDFTCLRHSAYKYIMEKAQDRILFEYVTAVLSR